MFFKNYMTKKEFLDKIKDEPDDAVFIYDNYEYGGVLIASGVEGEDMHCITEYGIRMRPETGSHFLYEDDKEYKDDLLEKPDERRYESKVTRVIHIY